MLASESTTKNDAPHGVHAPLPIGGAAHHEGSGHANALDVRLT